MAQTTYGIKVGYADSAKERVGLTYTYLSDITGIPSLGSTPNAIDVTTLTDASHKYIEGLMDIGGALEFPCLFSSTLIGEVDTAVLAEEGRTEHEWCVEFPTPIAKRYYFNGTVSLYNDSGDVDSALTGIVAITPSTVIESEDIV